MENNILKLIATRNDYFALALILFIVVMSLILDITPIFNFLSEHNLVKIYALFVYVLVGIGGGLLGIRLVKKVSKIKNE